MFIKIGDCVINLNNVASVVKDDNRITFNYNCGYGNESGGDTFGQTWGKASLFYPQALAAYEWVCSGATRFDGITGPAPESPQAAAAGDDTPLKRLSRIMDYCRANRKLIHSAFASSILVSVPTVKIEVWRDDFATVSDAIAQWKSGVTIVWNIKDRTPRYSGNDVTEKLPMLAETVTEETERAEDAAAVTVEQPIKREYHFTKTDGTPVVRYWTDEEYDQIIYDTYQSQEDEEYVEDMFWYGTDEDYDNALEVQRNRKQKPPDGKHAA